MTPVALALAEIGSRNGAKYSLGRKAPWCAHFITWLFREAGTPLPDDVLPTPASPGIGTPDALFSLGWPRKVTEPLPGDLAFFRQHSQWSTMHCAIVVAVGADGFSTVDGNYKGAVARRERKLTDINLICFSRFGV